MQVHTIVATEGPHVTKRDELSDANELATELEESLTRRHGHLLQPAALQHELGYPTAVAFRKALSRRRVPVPTFRIEGRKGHFALARDVARWLAEQRVSAGRSSATEAAM